MRPVMSAPNWPEIKTVFAPAGTIARWEKPLSEGSAKPAGLISVGSVRFTISSSIFQGRERPSPDWRFYRYAIRENGVPKSILACSAAGQEFVLLFGERHDG